MRDLICCLTTRTFEIEVKGEKEFGSREEGHDKEKFELVIERVANEIWMATVSCVKRRPKVAGSTETAERSEKKKKKKRRRNSWNTGQEKETRRRNVERTQRKIASWDTEKRRTCSLRCDKSGEPGE